ncbi:MAG: hypothetical protein E6R03_05820 [Hyphomicrobiaceae bacterium]|nr:MAG: hypothetical protein E6R03_05820 [Hyphomicrobiaceae bacterium]
MDQIVIHRGRTVVVPVSVSYDLTGSTITSDIRKTRKASSDLIASWDVSFVTDGSDGDFLLKLPHGTTAPITDEIGYMDIKRIIGGEPTNIIDTPIQVVFVDAITH